MRKILVVMLAMVLVVGMSIMVVAAEEGENIGEVYQDGKYNYAKIDQDASEVASYDDKFAGHQAYIEQIGNRNKAWQFQNGYNNDFFISTHGNKNIAKQTMTGSGVPSGSEAVIFQTGNNNYAFQELNQQGNIAKIHQTGNYNDAYQYLNGPVNEMYATQNGSDNYVYQAVSGKYNFGKSTQLGNDNWAKIEQNGGNHTYGGNWARIKQDGNDNKASINQIGNSNWGKAKQIGNKNVADIDQY